MPAGLNHLAVFVAPVVFYLWGGLWYGLIFLNLWKGLVGPIPMNGLVAVYIASFVLG